MGEMFNLLEQETEIVDKPNAKPINVTKGLVKFSNVHFSYDSKRPILNDLNIEIQGGAKVAIVGSSGSGKSTIGRLLFRFYDVSGGSVSIDGQDIKNVTQSSLHNVIGVVPQDTVLFNDSIFYNIAYGKDNATTAEVEKAARAAQIHEFIVSLPDGYDTAVGERGLKLSGGEKQRLSIARAFLKDSKIILLDEATSSLDADSEEIVQNAINNLTKNKTTLVIAHRLSTIHNANKIFVLKEGKIINSGNHELLIKNLFIWAFIKNNLFKKLYCI